MWGFRKRKENKAIISKKQAKVPVFLFAIFVL